MKTKKAAKADLENKRSLFFQIGLIVSLAITLMAFEWAQHFETEPIINPTYTGEVDDIILPPVTFEKPEPKIEPPKPTIEFEIIEDEIDLLDNEIDFASINSEGDANLWDNYEFPEDEPEEPVKDLFLPFEIQEEPIFGKGGINEFRKYVGEHINFPAIAKEVGLNGMVVASFVIDEKGNITDIKILRSVDKILDDELVKVLKKSPRWKPGKQYGIPVRVQMQIPVNFKLSQ